MRSIIPDHAGDTMTTTLGRQQGDDELLAQLRELLILPSSPATTVNKVVDSGGPHAFEGRRRRHYCRRGSIKRPRDDGNTTNNRCSPSGKRRSKKQGSTCFVTSAPDFDGYRWRKYGQKQIEGAMYARSYYRCIRSAEQGCPAKRTVQRNDDDGGGAPAEYTVVRMGEHTCTATDDSLAAPVILETTAAVAAPDIIGTSKRTDDEDDDDDIFASAAGRSCCSTTTTTGSTGVESPAISDDITWRGGDYNVVDEYGAGTTLLDVHDYSWASSAPMEDFTGPIRSPVHVPQAAGCWSIEHFNFLLQLANNEPVSHYFSPAC